MIIINLAWLMRIHVAECARRSLALDVVENALFLWASVQRPHRQMMPAREECVVRYVN
jgi:hypothetical protein